MYGGVKLASGKISDYEYFKLSKTDNSRDKKSGDQFKNKNEKNHQIKQRKSLGGLLISKVKQYLWKRIE